MTHIFLDNSSITDISEAIKNKIVSERETVDHIASRICKNNRMINAYIDFDPEEAKRVAHTANEAILSGIPFAVKSNICVEGFRTTCASNMLKNFIPQYSAHVVEKMLYSGMLFTGTTNMDEFAMGSTCETSFFGPVRNPHDLEFSPGGSSGGSTAAVASGMAYCTLGSDTGGSIRSPASFCGVTGLKPSYGNVSRYGLIAFASSFDQIGPICRYATDCAAVLDVISVKDNRDDTNIGTSGGHYKYLIDVISKTSGMSRALAGIRLAVIDTVGIRKITEDMSEVYNKTAAEYEKLGCSCTVEPQTCIRYAADVYHIISSVQAMSNLSRYDYFRFGSSQPENYSDARTELFGEEVKRRLVTGAYALNSGAYDKALAMAETIRKSYKDLFTKYDAILMPVTPEGPPKIGEIMQDPAYVYETDIFTAGSSIAGLPAISFPCGKLKNGMPVGMQLIGNKFCEDTILKIAALYQERTGYVFEPSNPGEIDREIL